MAFLSDNDYKVVIDDKALQVVQQASPTNRANAESVAIEEISCYLRSRYDVSAIFTATGDSRNKMIVMYACDIALYHLISTQPQKMGYEIREIRYKLAKETLKDVQAGKVSPNLPTITGPDGETDINNPIRYGSEKKNEYGW